MQDGDKLHMRSEDLLRDTESTLRSNELILRQALQGRRSGDDDDAKDWEQEAILQTEETAVTAFLQESYEEVGMKPNITASREAADAARALAMAAQAAARSQAAS
eukprot:15204494-Alexandrium_andersonii.AAC.1